MIWFPWQQMLTGAILLVVALAIMRRQQDSFGLGRTAKFLMFAGIAAAALWAGATFPGVDDYLHRSFEPNAFFRSFVPFFIVWAIANARNLKRRAHNLPETLASFAVKCGFASGLAGRLLYDAAMHPVIDWPNRIHGRTWLLANGIGLAIYLVVYLGKRD